MLNLRQQQCLRGIGIAQWRERAPLAADEAEKESCAPASKLVEELPIAKIAASMLSKTSAAGTSTSKWQRCITTAQKKTAIINLK